MQHRRSELTPHPASYVGHLLPWEKMVKNMWQPAHPEESLRFGHNDPQPVDLP